MKNFVYINNNEVVEVSTTNKETVCDSIIVVESGPYPLSVEQAEMAMILIKHGGMVMLKKFEKLIDDMHSRAYDLGY